MSLQAVRGMNDLLPADSHRWQWLEDTLRDWLAAYGYREIRTPILEATELFVRSIGEVTDIVEKEMYSFTDSLNSERLTLRPEGTAGCVRAVNQHNLIYNGPARLWYMGPMFRHERPQKGRYRQFHQLGVEAPGFAGAELDAEHLVMVARLWRLLGLEDARLEINSLGSPECRQAYRSGLVAYLESRLAELDEDARRRLHSNPLRVLDSKNPAMAGVIADAPVLTDHLDAASQAHFDEVRGYLDAAGVPYVVNPRLVRGLDYYNHTVHEWITDRLGAQGTICAGGRYDGLIGGLGGRPAPACGFAIGLERLVALLSDERIPAPAADLYLVCPDAEGRLAAMLLAERLRDDGLSVILHGAGGSMKSQMKKADASGARFAGILGSEERASDSLAVKDLRGEGGQRTLPVAGLAAALGRRP